MVGMTVIRSGILLVSLLFAHSLALAAEQPALTWSDRVTVEQESGDLVDTPPIVQVGEISLSRFSQMQSVTLQETLKVDAYDGPETVYVFKVWQGGASQGEQLMLVTLSQQGLDILGPHETDFETLKVIPSEGNAGPVFELFRADTASPLVRLEYFTGQLIELN
ncbi:hypothetical protein ABLO27_07460 [Roseibium sp. SCPC15]|uniref:hypothetical protein n=1 Tax=Roseibium sp. SCP15 TaxID=3141376 RepID=UPI00333C7780